MGTVDRYQQQPKHLRKSMMTKVQFPVGASPQHRTVVKVQSLKPSVELQNQLGHEKLGMSMLILIFTLIDT